MLAGPTAVGKSEIALLLAEQFDGEIVSVDSMQVYRGLDIGTAKPAQAERVRVPHHLVDVVEVTAAFDVSQFVSFAHRAVAEIRSRGRLPIFCGGTGLYFRAFLEGLGEPTPSDPALRAQVEATALPDLLRELAERDPVTFERIDRQNRRRVVRAVEVIRLTGRPFSQQRAAWGDAAPATASRPPFFALSRSTEDLRRRIDARVDLMFERGLVAETERLLQRGLSQNRNAMQALGYRQVAEHLQGVRPLPETIELVKIRTRQFARRQMTWFRRQRNLTWLRLEPDSNAAEIAAQIARGWVERQRG